jgi:hypothetical protein
MRNASPLQLAVCALWLATAPLRAQIQPVQPDTSEPALTVEHLDAVVVSSLDGKPVARVLVTSPDRRMAVLTDSEGRFSFDLRRPASAQGESHVFSSWPPTPVGSPAASNMLLTFMLRKPGYINGNVLLHLPAAKPDTSEPPLQLKIVPAATLTGHLDPDSGDLPEHSSVQLRRKQIQDGAAVWTPSGGAPVDSRGQFRFANLEPGDYKLLAPAYSPQFNPGGHTPDSVTGFLPAFYPNTDTLAAAQTIHLGPGDSATANLAFHNATFYRVAIPVTGLPENSGFQINLQPQIDGLYLSINEGTASGYLPGGDYDLQLTANVPGPTPNVVPSQLSAAVHLHIAGRPVQMEPIALHPGLELPIVVRRELTNPPPETDRQYPFSLWVNLQPSDPSANTPLMAPMTPGKDDSGLKIENLTAGTFRVQVAPRLGYAATVTSGSTDLLREPLRVSAASIPQPIEVTLRDDFATLTIHVPAGDPAQPPAADASEVFLLVIPLDRLQAQSFVVSWQDTTQNQYTLPGIPPGRYLVLASRHPIAQNIEFRNEEVLHDLLSEGAAVTLSPSQKADVQVPFLPEDTN